MTNVFLYYIRISKKINKIFTNGSLCKSSHSKNCELNEVMWTMQEVEHF